MPALLPRIADVSADYLPLTRANIIRQAFKFLGERYGWGHSYDARDCSGFVSEVYRSFGVQLPRNTRDQSVSPALNRLAFSAADGRDKRMAAVRELQVGDLVYIPGHVMMVIGHDDGMPYVIHDTNGGSWLGADGEAGQRPPQRRVGHAADAAALQRDADLHRPHHQHPAHPAVRRSHATRHRHPSITTADHT